MTTDYVPKQLPMFDVIELPLTKGRIAIIDPIDADLMQYKWTARINVCNKAYAFRCVKGKEIHLHRVILSRILNRPLLRKEFVDHIDLDSLNNRRSNLRIATASQNNVNKALSKHNKSGYKGVWWAKNESKWHSAISVGDGTKRSLGYFDDPKEAYEAYCRASIEIWGEFSRLK